MIPKSLQTVLVFALPVLVTTFAVLMGGAALARATASDPTAGNVLQWVAAAIGLLAVIDLVLLVGVLGLQSLQSDSRPPHRDE